MAVRSVQEIRAFAKLKAIQLELRHQHESDSHQSAWTLPQNDAELWAYVAKTWGISIPRTAVCPDHVAPFTAFADAYFARDSMIVWEASRGLGGKSFMLSILGLTIACTRGGDVNILGGSRRPITDSRGSTRQYHYKRKIYPLIQFSKEALDITYSHGHALKRNAFES